MQYENIYTMDNLIFRRQFILANNEITGFESFIKRDLNQNDTTWHLYSHPDLPVTSVKNPTFHLVMLGYILDPHNPSFNDETILQELSKSENFSSLTNSLEKYNGRFVIIFLSESKLNIINDAVGFRTVFYYFHNQLSVCGSSPDIIAKAFNIDKTKDQKILAFLNSIEYRNNDHAWIGDKTPYENVFQLFPNHFLSVLENRIFRFWPTKPLNRIDLDTCATRISEILKGTLTAAANRYKLHMGITAGWDTRLLLSATSHIKEKMFYYVNKYESFTNQTKDIRIPIHLSEKLDFKLNVVDIPNNVDTNFRDVFNNNVCWAHEKLLPVFYEVFRRNWQDTYTVTGVMGNGLARVYMQLPDGIPVNGKNIAKFAGYQNLDYPVSELDKWANEIRQLCKDNHIEIMNLYQWEQDNAHWATLTALEQDIIREEIAPFNNRELINLFWSLDPKWRYQYYPVIYIKIMKILWKEVLDLPFNPSFRSFLYRVLRTLGLERQLYYYYKRRKIFKNLE